MKNQIFYLLLLVSLIMTSCSKEIDTDELDIKVDDREVKVITDFPSLDGNTRLLFDDYKHFGKIINEFEELDLEELLEHNDMVGFTSSYSEWMKNSEAQSDQILKNIIDDKVFASLLNESNEMAFKNGEIYRINTDFCYKYKDGFEHLIEEFGHENDSYKDEIKENMAFTYKDNLIIEKTIQESVGDEEITFRGDLDREFSTWGERVKLIGRTHRRNYLVYKYIRAVTEAERRNGPFWNSWQNGDISRLYVARDFPTRLEWSSTFFFDIPRFYINKYNDNKVTYNLYIVVGGGVTVGGGNVSPALLPGGFPEVPPGQCAIHYGHNNFEGHDHITFETCW